MVTTGQGRNGDVDARLAALRAGADGLMPPRPGTASTADDRRAAAENRSWRRTRRVASLVTIILLVAAASFAAGWITATLQSPESSTLQAVGPAQPAPGPSEPVANAPVAVAPQPGQGHSPTYTYGVHSNYPMSLSYVAANGDEVDLDAVAAPWTLQVTTADWGADAAADVFVYVSSEKGDAFVTCAITDASGRVVASDRTDAASPAARCRVS